EQLGAIRDRQPVAISATGETTAETAVLLFLLHREPARPIERSSHTSLNGCGSEEPKGGADSCGHRARAYAVFRSSLWLSVNGVVPTTSAGKSSRAVKIGLRAGS